MTEFKILDNGIELYYSNLLLLEEEGEEEYQVTVRAEKWNSDMFRYEGLDVVLPSGKIENIEFLKSNQIEEFKNSILENQEDIIKLAKKDSLLFDEGDDLIELSEKSSDKEKDKEPEIIKKEERNEIIEEIESERMDGFVEIIEIPEKKEEPSFFQKLLNRFF